MTKWGIAGTGMIARAFAASIKDSKNSKLKYVASRSEENSSRFAKKYGCEAVKGYQNLLNLDDCDAIYIATPHPQHFELALNSLQKGKAVLCEKPMTMNSTEAMILIEAARKNNTLFMEAFMYRTHPQTQKIREIIKDYFSEEPLEIEASFGFEADVPEEHRLVNPELGGGSIRIHDRELQSKVFTLLGIDNDEAQEKFGFLMDAFKFLRQCDKKFDIIIADPPYDRYNCIDIFNECLPLIDKGGMFCMEMRKKSMEESIFRKKVYGSTQVVFWEDN